MRRDLSFLALLFFIAASVYLLSLRFVFPGYVDPFTPHHTDFYLPPSLSYDGHTIGEKLMWPRPLGFLVVQVLGKLGLQGYLFVFASVALASAALTISLAGRILGRQVSLIAALVYCALLFGHPDFYANYLHDGCATLSLFYLLIALHAWYQYLQTGGRRYVAISIVAMILVGFTKETYFVSAVLLWLTAATLCRGEQRKTSLVILASSLAAFAGAFWANAHSLKTVVGMKFGASDPYHMSLAPAVLAKGALFYGSHLFPPVAFVLVAAALVVVFLRDRQHAAMAAAFAGAGLCAVFTHAVLPNHMDTMYAWTGAPLAFAVVLFVPWQAKFHGGGIVALQSALAITVIWSYTYANAPRFEAYRWMLEQEKTNRNIIAAYPALKQVKGTANVLITGLSMPYHPFYTSGYIRAEFGKNLRWAVVVPREVAAKSDPLVRLVKPEAINPADYDHAFGFGDDGTLRHQWSRGQLREATGGEARDRVLFPPLNAVFDKDPKWRDKWYSLLQVGQAYWVWGDLERAADYYRRSAEMEGRHNPYPFFFLGEVHEKQGKIAEAAQSYAQAVALDGSPPNAAFKEALARIRKQ